MNQINIEKRLEDLRTRIQRQDFLLGKGLSNEVNIHIFCYHPKEEMIISRFVEQRAKEQNTEYRLIECNLYKIFLDLCQKHEILAPIMEMEEADGKEYLLRQLQAAITGDDFVAMMKYEPHSPGDVLLLTGIGDVFPFMRIHSLLETMQPYFNDIPILVMYPGTFDGNSLTLFNELPANPYYRAFNII